MTESKSPDIDVDQLVAKIRQEVARRRAESRGPAIAAAQLDAGDGVAGARALQAGIGAAEQQARIATLVPDWPDWNGLKRRFGRLVARVVMRLAVFITAQQREFNLAVLALFRDVASGLSQLEAAQRQTQTGLVLLEDGFDRVERRLSERERPLDDRLDRMERFASEAIERLQNEVASRNARTDDVERKVLALQTDLIVYERRLERLLEEARRRLPAPLDAGQLQVLAEEATQAFNGFYAALEDQFRGSREDIKSRARVYVPIIKEVGPGAVLDLGSGRGEWLEVLRDEGVSARGVDVNRPMVEACCARGFDVVEGDALVHLRGLPDASLAAVSGMHLIEHLPFEKLIVLFDEAVRVLRPGGVAIFETPNPANLIVGSCNFYQDPTHQRPIPAPLAQYLAEARGLCRVRILPLHPCSESFRLRGSELAERVSEHLYGPQDYAVVGYRA